MLPPPVCGSAGSPRRWPRRWGLHTFLLASSIVVVWAVLGPHFGWSETHQLVINTFTTIVTFLAVFLIQNTQNRDTKSLHLKIDELLKATGARETA